MASEPMTTPEPSPLSEKTLDAWESSARAARFDGRSVEADPERLLELIAQARAAQSGATLRERIQRMMGHVCASCEQIAHDGTVTRPGSPMTSYNTHADGFECQAIRYRDVLCVMDEYRLASAPKEPTP